MICMCTQNEDWLLGESLFHNWATVVWLHLTMMVSFTSLCTNTWSWLISCWVYLCGCLLIDVTLQADMEASMELAANADACFKLHGKNIILSDDGRSAERRASYNHGIVISRHPLRPGHVFQVRDVLDLHLLSLSSLLSAQITVSCPVELSHECALKQNCNKTC